MQHGQASTGTARHGAVRHGIFKRKQQQSCQKKRFQLRISSIWRFEGFFAELHEYICMSKLGRFFVCAK
jgi:hypothetical protein